MLKVTYISHSGFLVELEEAYLLFDYYQGTIPQFEREKKVYVFASHSHHDHFNHNIFNLLKRENEIHFILSDDIQVEGFNEVTPIGPNTELTVGDCRITTLTSTDEGVAFLVEHKGCNIYHAGDLNWWHWNGESEKYNEDMKANYQREINKLRGQEIDLAFVTLDLRLEDAYLLGLDYFVRQTNTKAIIPMHFWGNYEVFGLLKSNIEAKDYIDKIVCIREEGEVFCL